ncbi:hypothetical protein Pmani_015093 [Petrolisthes manimaculis]|uniref:Uncharacterized protein n=1 Tax=Petrolisthes manimaculis TaxID=1843537 RepID=A0AAE1PRL3_9EUCA|nr:hypothetical protein Pmani_015093 [Petrolisthes manimaculis]
MPSPLPPTPSRQWHTPRPQPITPQPLLPSSCPHWRPPFGDEPHSHPRLTDPPDPFLVTWYQPSPRPHQPTTPSLPLTL